jgi:hypothetical protein
MTPLPTIAFVVVLLLLLHLRLDWVIGNNS